MLLPPINSSYFTVEQILVRNFSEQSYTVAMKGQYIGVMDCNNFFVSCERLFRPDLEGKPVAVLSSNDGCIVARSNEAKEMGIPMGIPLFQAKVLVNMSQVTLFSSNFTLYRDISSRVMEVLVTEVGECEVYSVDEAFFTIPNIITEAELQTLRTRIMNQTGIPVSIGIGPTKTIAKAAVEQEKRGSGVCIFSLDKWHAAASEYPCSEVWNIGRQTTKKLQAVGILMADQFIKLDQSYVDTMFGIFGRRIQAELQGIKVYPVETTSNVLRQSLTSSRSFATAVKTLPELESAVAYHVTQLAAKLRSKQYCCTRISVGVRAGKHSEFVGQRISGDAVLETKTNSTNLLVAAALSIVRKQFNSSVPYKKVGVTVSGLQPPGFEQGSLFNTQSSRVIDITLDQVTDALNVQFGQGTIHLGTIQATSALSRADLRSPEYTTRWQDIPRVKATD